MAAEIETRGTGGGNVNRIKHFYDMAGVPIAPRDHELNVVALVKGEERYIFLYDDRSRADCLLALGRMATRPDLSFTWYDAAVLSNKVREAKPKTAES
jgi:hypothetical protein